MNSKLKITIPTPCHENWNTMTPKEKGRFCGSCAKTVIDFTKKSTTEIQDYLIENRNQKTCGHFYKKQLDSITIEIPQVTFQQQLSFQKLFVLALFFVMGTTLFSCQYADGKKQKIENVVIIDTLKKVEEKIDTIKHQKDTVINTKKIKISPTPTTGIIISETSQKKDTLFNLTTTGDVVEVIETVGDVEIIDGMIELDYEPEETIGFIIIEESPKFKESKNLPKEKAKEDFEIKMRTFVYDNFDKNLTQCLDLNKGRYKIQTQFTIDEEGNVIDVKARAPHKKIEKEVIKMLKKLPQFIPGKQKNKAVKTKYTLPISFEVE